MHSHPVAFSLFMAVALGAQPGQAQTASPDPERLVTLRDGYERALERAAAPIRSTYLQELEKLKAEYLKAGNLNAAVAVDKEIKERQPVIPQSAKAPMTLKGMSKLAVTQYQGMATLPLKVGGKLYADAPYAWTQVPEELAGLKYSQPKGKHDGVTSFRVDTDGLVYMAVSSGWIIPDKDKGEGNKVSRKQLERDGWKHLGDKHNLKCDDAGTEWLVFARTCKAGETFTIQTAKYAAPMVLSN
jgi:hypothetical protein